MNALEIIDAGGKLEQVLFKLHMAAHGDEPLNYGKLCKSAKHLTMLPIESLQALLDIERAFQVKKQRDTVADARRRGISFGRSEKDVPENYAEVMHTFLQGELSGLKAAEELHMPYSTFMWRARKERKRREMT